MRLYLSSFGLGNCPEAMMALLNGKNRVAVIMNAGDNAPSERREASLNWEIDGLKGLGLESVEIDLRHYFGRKAELRQKLNEFDMVWVRGGNCFTLRRAFRQSGADEILEELLIEDRIVYAGYSAAIDMLVPSMRGAELVDNPYAVPEGYDPEIIWDGLGLLPYAVAPHYKSDHPESADIDKSVEYLIDHHIPFIALRDGEAIVVDATGETVVGTVR